jgi:hypothetical protein
MTVKPRVSRNIVVRFSVQCERLTCPVKRLHAIRGNPPVIYPLNRPPNRPEVGRLIPLLCTFNGTCSHRNVREM